MTVDTELASWRRQWQSRAEPQELVALKDRAIRDTRLAKIWLVAPVLVTIVMGGWVIVRAANSGRTSDVAFAVCVWILIFTAWAGSLWLARGTWRAPGETTAAFVDLAIRRCKSTLRMTPFAVGLYVTEVLLVVSWTLVDSGLPARLVLTSWPMVLIGWLGGPALFAFLIRQNRLRCAELTYLLDVQRQLLERE